MRTRAPKKRTRPQRPAPRPQIAKTQPQPHRGEDAGRFDEERKPRRGEAC